MNNFTSLIDQIRDPLQTILLDCRAVGTLISQEEGFQFEFEKTVNDGSRLINIVNTFLSFHIFKDGQVRVDMATHASDSDAKKFFLESFIQGCVSFRTSLVTLLLTVRSIDRLAAKGNRSLYSLLKNKLNGNLSSLTDRARGLIRSCAPDDAASGGVGVYTSDSVSLISTNFLVSMKSITEVLNTPTLPTRPQFEQLRQSYSTTYDSFIELLRDCVFDISKHIDTVVLLCGDILATSTTLYDRATLQQQQQYQQQQIVYGNGIIDIQSKATLERSVYDLVDTIKKIYPIVSQSVSRIPSSYPLPTKILPINLDVEEDMESERERERIRREDFNTIINDLEKEKKEKEEQEEKEKEEREREEERRLTNEASSIKLEDSNIAVGEEEDINIDTTPWTQGGAGNPSPSPAPKSRWGCDLPSIVLSDLSDDEEEDAPMIWSLPICTVSSDPFNQDKSRTPSGSNTPKNPSPRNSTSALAPPKVYSSKDYDINNIGKKNGKLGSIFKNPFKSKGDKSDKPEKLHGKKSPNSQSTSSSPQLSSAGSSTATSPVISGLVAEGYKSNSSPQLVSSGPSSITTPSSIPIQTNPNHRSAAMSAPSALVLNDSAGSPSSPVSRHLDLNEDMDDNSEFLDIPVGLRGHVCDASVTLFEQTREFQIEEVGEKSKRFSHTGVVLGFDHNERHIAHYEQYFYRRDHLNFTCRIGELGGSAIISILKDPESITEKKHRTLILTPSGLEKILIYSSDSKDSNLIKGIQNYLKPICTISTASFKLAKLDKISPLLLSFEKMEITMKYHFFVMFYGDGMVSEREMLNNDRVSKEFIDFYKFLGKPIQLKGWRKYAGGLDTTNNTDGETCIHAEMAGGIEVVFHIANLIPQSRRKDIMSRNTITIVFHEGKTPLNPTIFSSQKNQIYFDIRKVKIDDGHHVHYKFGVATSHTIQPFGPMLQSPPIYKKDNSFKHLLLTKLINGENAAFSTSQMNQASTKYRLQKIDEIVSSVK